MNLPLIIQGGMGAGISSWRLAKTVSQMGQLGVVSGTALDLIFARRLQLGDIHHDLRRAIAHFPFPELANRVLDKYWISEGKEASASFKLGGIFTADPTLSLLELTVVANFVEVYLAKENHSGWVGINFLEKIQLPNLASLYGAMLAGVDYVLMGAGIPREIPAVLDKLARHEEVSLSLYVDGALAEDHFKIIFNPQSVVGSVAKTPLKRPKFLPIVSSHVLAATLAKKCEGKIDGFVIEGSLAGGHNALPRGPLTLNSRGEPIYGPRDEVDFSKIKEIGLPFWVAGSFSTPEKIKEALAMGAAGVQIGTAFAFSEESGLDADIKARLIEKSIEGEGDVYTDPKVSPTKFPFKVVKLENSLSEKEVYDCRPRICDLGYLRHLYKREDGAIGYRCPGEPIQRYLEKGGKLEDTVGRKCLCNSLLANIGLAQIQKNGYIEKPLVTAGEDYKFISRFIKDGQKSYSAADVIQSLLQNI